MQLEWIAGKTEKQVFTENRLWLAFGSCFLYLGLWGICQNITQADWLWTLSMTGGLLFQLFLCLAEGRERMLRWGKRSIFLLCLLTGLAAVKYLNGGILLLANGIRAHTGSILHVYYRDYEIGLTQEETGAGGVVVFFFLGMILSCAIAWIKIHSGNIKIAVFSLLILAGTFYGADWLSLGLLLTGELILTAVSAPDAVCPALHRKRAGAWLLGTLFLGSMVFMVISLTELQSYTKALSDRLQSGVQEQVEQLRYGGTELAMPQGRLWQAGSFQPTGAPALKVIMNRPQSYYLRGFVGGCYTGRSWSGLDSETYYQQKSLFFWLQRDGFSPFCQLSALQQLTQGGGQQENVFLAVENTGACAKYLYTPYELATSPEQFGAGTYQDTFPTARGLSGQKEYQYEAAENLVASYTELAERYYEQREEEEFSVYLKDETGYSDFVYQNYTEIPQYLKNLFDSLLSRKDDELAEGGHYDYESANIIVYQFLNENLSYTENCGSCPDGQDFITYTLSESGKGYSVHYASVAALLYRYLGIPARYVEGYLITPEMAREAEAYQEIIVTQKEAHAWVEIYLDGLGWIPMEMTPKYYDVMERPAQDTRTETEEQQNTGEGSSRQQTIQDGKEPEQEIAEQEGKFSFRVLVSCIAAAFLFLFAVIVLCRLFFRKRKKKRRPELLLQENREYILLLYIWFWERMAVRTESKETALWKRMMIRENYEPVLLQLFGAESGCEIISEYQKALAVVDQAVYSETPVSDSQREEVKQFVFRYVDRNK